MGCVIETTLGNVRGREEADHQAYRGLPFAQPPLGALRFRPPEAARPWSGLRDATSFGPSAPQNKVDFDLVPGLDVGPQSEDCLYLNVLTPSADAQRRPVMVWIHGGAFTSGSGSQQMYDMRPLVRRGDVVVVSINYRLGAFGFLHLTDRLGAAHAGGGNAGMLDQVAALEWVRDNIERFGGDPERVTVFGESAGGMAVGTLLGMPAARGLFARAIPQSGAASAINSAAEASDVARVFLEELSPEGDAEAALALLQTAPVEDLLAAQAGCIRRRESAGAGSLRPVIDGEVLPVAPLDAIRAGSARGVAVMVGCTRDECKLFALQDTRLQELDEAGLQDRVAAWFPDAGEQGREFARGLVARYRAAREATGRSCSPREIFLALQTDRQFRVPALALAEAQLANDARTYAYLVSYESPLMEGGLGACHGIDMPFVLGATGTPAADLFAGTGPDVERLERAMFDAWLCFARTGDPNHAALPPWAPYELTRRPTMVFDRACRVEDDPLGEERRAWDPFD